MSDVRISYQNNKFLIKCPMIMNDALANISGKRWSKANKYWQVPPLRRNVEAVADLVKMGAFITEEGKAGLQEHQDRLAVMNQKTEGFPAWFPFKTKPLSHQIIGLNRAYDHRPFAYFMDRGTGKSWMAVNEAAALRMEGKIQGVVVIVKKTLRKNWVGWDKGDQPGQREGFVGHSPIPCQFHLPDGGDASAMKKYASWLGQDHDFPILIVAMESLSQGGAVKIVKSFMQAFLKVMVVVDESQDIGNHDSIRSKAVHEFGLQAAYNRTLTGSPISTGPMNLYSQFEFLDPNIIGMGDYYAFRNRYAEMGGFPNPKTGKPTKIIGYQNMDELFALLAPHVYQVRKEDVLDLPPKVFERRVIQLTQEQKDLYRQIKRSGKYEHDGTEIEVSNTLELALRLHTIAGGFLSSTSAVNVGSEDDPKIKKQSKWTEIIPPDRNPKLQELVATIRDNPDRSFIVWAFYKPEIELITRALQAEFPGELVVGLHGGVPDAEREAVKEAFQSKRARFLVGNTITGGTGHTLTACEIMVFWNNTERMIDREQAEDRAHRYGLLHSVLYIDLIAEGTVDETIMESVDEKMDLAEFIRVNIQRHADLLGAL
jgi:hypothetical protein